MVNRFNTLRTHVLVALLLASFPALQAADFWVAPFGNDLNAGSSDSPFRTIGHAVAKMHSGDRCILRGGTYREEVVVGKPNLSIIAQEGEAVLLTGCDLISGWETHRIEASGVGCQCARAAQKVYAAFLKGKPLPLARWPDKSVDLLSLKDWAEGSLDGKRQRVVLPTMPAKSDGYWRGGIYVGMHSPELPLSGWFSIGGRVVASNGDSLTLDQPTYGLPSEHTNQLGFGYIIDCLNALDADGEWCWRDGVLYVKGLTTGVEAQTRLFILHAKADGLTLQGLHFKAGAVNVAGKNATIRGCTFRYSSAFHHVSDLSGALNWGDPAVGASGVYVTGTGADIRDCYFGHSWWSGLTLAGSHILVENCIVEDCNWIARRGGGIECYGDDNVIRHCTVRRTGAACIEGGNAWWLGKYGKRNLWEFNRCEEGGCLVVDTGLFYVNQQNGRNPPADSEWRYNFLVNNRGPDRGDWRRDSQVGLYVDNSSSGYRVHHNIVVGCTHGIRYNDNRDGEEAGHELLFCNNTFYKTERAFALGLWKEPKNKGGPPARMDAGITLRNNLAIDCGKWGAIYWDAPIGDNNYGMVTAGPNVIDAATLDFRLKPGSRFIDCGVIVPGITDGYHGAWPDIGAMETGAEPWTAGARLTVPRFPDESTDHPKLD